MGGEQILDPLAEGGVVAAGLIEVRGPLGRVGPFEGLGEEGHQSGVVVGHGFTSGSGFSLTMTAWRGERTASR